MENRDIATTAKLHPSALVPPRKADMLNETITSLINVSNGEDIPNWRVLALAAAIGPFLLQLFYDNDKGLYGNADDNDPMLRILFTDDGSDYVISPDGGGE